VTPRHAHDCEKCTFLGCYGDADLYHCTASLGGPTVIARYGREDDYASAPVWMRSTAPEPQPLPGQPGLPELEQAWREQMAALRVAYLIAVDAGLPTQKP